MFSRKLFTSLFSCALVALCFLSGGCSGSGSKGFITKQQVSAFLEEMDRAANNKDVDAIVDKLANDLQIKITLEGFGPTQTLVFDRDQYIDYSRQGFAAAENYVYRRGETVIKVEPDGQSAFVADETFESVTLGGQALRTVSRTNSVLKLEDGKLVLARSEATTRAVNSGEKAKATGF